MKRKWIGWAAAAVLAGGFLLYRGRPNATYVSISPDSRYRVAIPDHGNRLAVELFPSDQPNGGRRWEGRPLDSNVCGWVGLQIGPPLAY